MIPINKQIVRDILILEYSVNDKFYDLISGNNNSGIRDLLLQEYDILYRPLEKDYTLLENNNNKSLPSKIKHTIQKRINSQFRALNLRWRWFFGTTLNSIKGYINEFMGLLNQMVFMGAITGIAALIGKLLFFRKENSSQNEEEKIVQESNSYTPTENDIRTAKRISGVLKSILNLMINNIRKSISSKEIDETSKANVLIEKMQSTIKELNTKEQNFKI